MLKRDAVFDLQESRKLDSSVGKALKPFCNPFDHHAASHTRLYVVSLSDIRACHLCHWVSVRDQRAHELEHTSQHKPGQALDPQQYVPQLQLHQVSHML
jgi:hypothetical protein